MSANEIMQHSVLTANPDMSLALAWRLMEDHRIRHLPVVSNGCLIGLITDRDLRTASLATAGLSTPAEATVYMGTTTVKSCMTQDVVTISPTTPITTATQHILDNHVGCLPVIDQGQLVGVITEIDLLRASLASATPKTRRLTVKDAMQDLLIIVVPEDLVSTAYQRMQGGIVRHLPILDDDGKLVGVITDRDIRQAGDFGQTTLATPDVMDQFGTMMIRDLMTTDIVSVRSHTLLTEATELFLSHKFGCLPVIRDDDTLEGLLTVTDLLTLYVDQIGSAQDRLNQEGN